MKQVIYKCDRCGKECGESDLHKLELLARNYNMVLNYMPVELCDECRLELLRTNYKFMGWTL